MEHPDRNPVKTRAEHKKMTMERIYQRYKKTEAVDFI